MHNVQAFEYSVSRGARGPLSLDEGEYILLLGTVIVSSFLYWSFDTHLRPGRGASECFHG